MGTAVSNTARTFSHSDGESGPQILLLLRGQVGESTHLPRDARGAGVTAEEDGADEALEEDAEEAAAGIAPQVSSLSDCSDTPADDRCTVYTPLPLPWCACCARHVQLSVALHCAMLDGLTVGATW